MTVYEKRVFVKVYCMQCTVYLKFDTRMNPSKSIWFNRPSSLTSIKFHKFVDYNNVLDILEQKKFNLRL